MAKKIVSKPIKVNTAYLLDECIERGIEHGFNRAHKHQDKPNADLIKEEIFRAITNNISEYFTFE